MKKTKSSILLFGGIGVLFGFACGFLYGLGGFIHDLILSEINWGSFLALNALWGMPLIGVILGSAVGLLLNCLSYLARKLSTAKR